MHNSVLNELTSKPWLLTESILNSVKEVALRHMQGDKLDPISVDQIVAVRKAASDETEPRFKIFGDVAVVTIDGIILKRMGFIERASHLGTSTAEIQKNITAALNDPDVKAIVLDIDSPGGSVAGIEETGNLIAKVNKAKPVVAYTSGIMASAAYWLGSQASSIVSVRTAELGSIGVYMVVVDSSKLHSDAGVTVNVVRSKGDFKGTGEIGTKLTDTQRAMLQAVVDDLYDVFVSNVASGRGMSIKDVKRIADGSISVGKSALSIGLIDKLGDLNDAVALAGELSVGNRATATITETLLKGSEDMAKIKEQANASGTIAGDGTGIVLPTVVQGTTDANAPIAPVPIPAAISPAVTAINPDEVATIKADATKAEIKRQDEIRAMASSMNLDTDWTQKQIESMNSLDKARESAMEKFKESKQPSNVMVGEDLNTSSIGQAMVDHFLNRAGYKVDKPHERAATFTGRTLHECARMHCEAWGMDTSGMSRSAIARAAFVGDYMPPGIRASAGGGFGGHTGSDFPLLLQDASNKTLQSGYLEAPRTWMRWMRKRPAPDFKNINTYKFGEFPDLTLVPEGNEYEYATIAEGREVYNLAKYGKVFSITWEAIVNDDLDAFTRIPAMMGTAAGRLEEVIAYTPLTIQTGGQEMADGVDLFHADHNNLVASGTVLSVVNLGIARSTMRLQTGLSSVLIDVDPHFLIVPPGIQTTAEQLISSLVDPAKSNATPNPFATSLEVISPALLASHDANAWYLGARHQQIDTIEVAFLEGEEMPFLEQQNGFAVDGRKYKVRHTIASHAIDHRGLFKNNGA